jgi:hypothetical protein
MIKTKTTIILNTNLALKTPLDKRIKVIRILRESNFEAYLRRNVPPRTPKELTDDEFYGMLL